MNLEDQTIDEGRRTFLRGSAIAAGMFVLDPTGLLAQDGKAQATQIDNLPELKKRRISFDIAKKGDQSLKMKYLDQLLVEEFKLVYDDKLVNGKKRNPNGFVGEWFYWQDKSHQKTASDRITREEGVGNIKPIEDALPTWIIIPRYQVPGQSRSGAKTGYLIIDESIFKLANEDEVFSVFDYTHKFSKNYEDNLCIRGREMSIKNHHLNLYSNSLINLDGRSIQLANILSGKRKKVSDEFKKSVIEYHLEHYSRTNKWISERKAAYSAHQNDLDKEAYEFMETLVSEIDDRLKAAGYEHKLVDEKNHKYELVKVSEPKK